MKVTVCELRNRWVNSDDEREKLIRHIATAETDFLLLPEMPLHEWLPGEEHAEKSQWEKAVVSHDSWINRFEEFDVPLIAGTRPILKNNVAMNQGFVWSQDTGYHAVHEKYYLPNEAGFWENNWYQRGEGTFDIVQINGLNIAFLICTELWFSRHARDYSKQGIHLLLCPRATPSTSTGTWLAGGRAAANISGAYCLSSNFNGKNTSTIDFGGTGWITEPEEGDVLGKTDENSPFLTLEIDVQAAENAKLTYPRYVKD